MTLSMTMTQGLVRRVPLPALAAALTLAGPVATAMAAAPSLEVLHHFSGSQAGGGDGATPTQLLSEASDGYLYGLTSYGGGTDADMLAGTTQSANFGPYGGYGAVFYRLHRTGAGFEILSRKAAVLPNHIHRWITGPDGALYSPNNSSSGPTLHRYLPSDAAGWTTYGPSGSNTGASALTLSGGRFIVSRLSRPIRAISADGLTDTALITPSSSTVGTTPAYYLTDSDGTVYGVTTVGGGNGYGAVFRLITDGTAAGTRTTRLCGFDANLFGRYSGGPGQPLLIVGDHLYGITRGGAMAGGVFWRVRKDGTGSGGSGSIVCPHGELLHSFSTSDVLGGSLPSHLTLGQDGHLYAVTTGGIGLDGLPASGHIIRYRIGQDGAAGVLEVLHSFPAERPDPPRNNSYADASGTVLTSTLNTGANAGGHTPSTLMQASNGQFYGHTQYGGSHGWGTLFRFSPGDELPADARILPIKPHVILGAGTFSTKATYQAFALGGSARFYWSGVLSDNCVASSSEPGSTWAGARAREARSSTQSETVTPTQIGTWTYTLTCLPDATANAGSDPVSASVTLEVVPLVAEAQQVGTGGGAMDAWLLAPLATLSLGLAWWRRREHLGLRSSTPTSPPSP